MKQPSQHDLRPDLAAQTRPVEAVRQQPPPMVAQVPARINPTLQRIWVRSQMNAWTTMAIIGSSDKMPEGTMNVARGLARVAAESGGALGLIDGRALELKHLAQVQARLRSTVARQTVVVLPLPRDNPVTVSVAQACDAAIMCVILGETSRIVAAQTIEQVGRDRFLGSVILRPK
ncbi:MAG: hypothetical protein HOO96_17945 [Polyangiaceae bacterium]|nr:hypothetical protein [Polyangiaceae bacterium]